MPARYTGTSGSQFGLETPPAAPPGKFHSRASRARPQRARARAQLPTAHFLTACGAQKRRVFTRARAPVVELIRWRRPQTPRVAIVARARHERAHLAKSRAAALLTLKRADRRRTTRARATALSTKCSLDPFDGEMMKAVRARRCNRYRATRAASAHRVVPVKRSSRHRARRRAVPPRNLADRASRLG